MVWEPELSAAGTSEPVPDLHAAGCHLAQIVLMSLESPASSRSEWSALQQHDHAPLHAHCSASLTKPHTFCHARCHPRQARSTETDPWACLLRIALLFQALACLLTSAVPSGLHVWVSDLIMQVLGCLMACAEP